MKIRPRLIQSEGATATAAELVRAATLRLRDLTDDDVALRLSCESDTYMAIQHSAEDDADQP